MDGRNDSSMDEKQYELPDGQVIIVGKERFECTELMFSGHVNVTRVDEIVEMIDDEDLKKKMWGNVVLCGGNSMFEGFDKRLQKELSKYNDNVKVIGGEHDGFEIWYGGSILASMTGFTEQWVLKDEYDEIAPDIVHYRCF